MPVMIDQDPQYLIVMTKKSTPMTHFVLIANRGGAALSLSLASISR